MNILIAGATGYIGSHVTSLFRSKLLNVFTYNREGKVINQTEGSSSPSGNFHGYFDVIVNCARPHWSTHSPHEIADIEQNLLEQLDRLATVNATKIHTSGVWLFGKANRAELETFELKPLKAVQPDVETINKALRNGWSIVYCPSLVYGGDNCQLKRIIESLPDKTLQVAMPSDGYNQYVHVQDIATFYLLLVHNQPKPTQYFIAENQGYTPKEFAQLLHNADAVRSVTQVSSEEYESKHGDSATEVERLNLKLPVSQYFKPSKSIKRYIEESIWHQT